MKLFIRADATIDMGIGHIMRCISLAQAWEKSGGEVTFISASKFNNINELICKNGFDLVKINYFYPHPSDIKNTIDIINRSLGKKCWVVTDGYHFSPDYHEQIRKNGNNLLVIDDVGKFDYKFANIILNQEPNYNFFKKKYNKNSILLLGIKYLLIRKEFLEYNRSNIFSKKCNNILITIGGTDPNKVTTSILKSICENKASFDIKIILGLNSSQAQEINSIIEKNYKKVKIIENTNFMPEMMEWADLAITNGGTTTWELGFMGTPFIAIAVAKNQINTVNQIGKLEIGKSLGWFEDVSEYEYSKTINALIKSYPKRIKYSQNGKKIIDGAGADRVVKALLSYDK